VRPDSKVLCARCHQALAARPASFPQVEAAEHSGGEACTTCHQAHSPKDPPAEPATSAAAAAPEKEGQR
jgi:hypothetical protein